MQGEPMVMACVSDVAGQVRGKGFPARDFEAHAARGIGWCPTNMQITVFDAIAETPFGALGDVLLMPDVDTRVDVDFEPDDPGEHLVLCDIIQTDGRPWDCCLRTLLRNAAKALGTEHGLRLIAAFEHEFQYSGGDPRPGGSYALRSMRKAAAFGEMLVATLEQAGLDVGLLHPEYGAGQYEITIGAQPALRAADQAVILRELTRSVAERRGERATFAPVVAGMAVGNGVHVHMSLLDGDDRPVMYAADGPGGLSEVGGHFVAGILRHLPALLAFTAASTVSYQRLVPHRWSAAFDNLGLRDREAAMRICPVRERDDVARQFNVEYRAADAAASPHLLLAVLMLAGLEGLRRQLPCPKPLEMDLSTLSTEQLAQAGHRRLPTSLEGALAELEADEAVGGWLPPLLYDIYRLHKQGEIKQLAGLSEAEQAGRYADVY
jgi:glutamine synthetase